VAFRVSNIYKSLVRHLTDTIAQARDDGVSSDLQYFPWDSRGDEAELPSTDLIGLAGWSFSENRGLWEIHCGITISTLNDENLFREVELVDAIHNLWGEECPVPMRDDDGTIYTQLIVKEFEMLPAAFSEKRNFRPVGLTLRRTDSA
jgi:hypothetical protein